MAPVAKELEAFFEPITFSKPERKIPMNLTGNYEEENFKSLMARQVMETVRFKDVLETLLKSGVDVFVEFGHNKVLAGLMRRLNKQAKVLEVCDYESFLAVREELKTSK